MTGSGPSDLIGRQVRTPVGFEPRSVSHQTHSRRGPRSSRCPAGPVLERSSATRAHRRDAASKFRRSAAPAATARAHHAIQGRQVRLWSWLTAGSVWDGAKRYGTDCLATSRRGFSIVRDHGAHGRSVARAWDCDRQWDVTAKLTASGTAAAAQRHRRIAPAHFR
jgi:hypothetical protein